eukprot:3923441-Rhodomonas_salina.1
MYGHTTPIYECTTSIYECTASILTGAVQVKKGEFSDVFIISGPIYLPTKADDGKFYMQHQVRTPIPNCEIKGKKTHAPYSTRQTQVPRTVAYPARLCGTDLR